MNEVQKSYLELLRMALWGETDEQLSINEELLDDVALLAAFQGTGSLVYDQLLKLKDLNMTADMRMHMKQQCVHSMMLQQSMMTLLAKAWKALEDVDIHPVLLKGFGLAQYYPQPHLRQWGDIDVYVGRRNYHLACAVLRDTFPDAEYGEVEDEAEKHYNFDFPNTVIETHRVSMTFSHPIDRRWYEELEEKYLTKDGPKCEMERLSVTLPDVTFNVFFIFLHAWHHFVGTGMNMKQVCDIAILLNVQKEYIDQVRLHRMLTKLCLLEVWQLIMYILVKYLGVSQDGCPFYNEQCGWRAEILFEHIMCEGSTYRRKKIYSNGVPYLRRKWQTFLSRLADSRRVHPYAPQYARHMVISDFLHGVERTMRGI